MPFSILIVLYALQIEIADNIFSV